MSRSGGEGHERSSRSAAGGGNLNLGDSRDNLPRLAASTHAEPTIASYASAPPTSDGQGVAAERDELRETVEILELKIRKLEQLVRLKDSRIQTLTARLQNATQNSGGAQLGSA